MLSLKLSKRERYIALVSIGIILFLFVDKFVISQVVNKLAVLNEEIVILENKLEKSKNLLYQEDLIASEYEKYTGKIKKQKSDEETVVKLLSSIEKVANNTSIYLVDIKPALPVTEGFFTKYTIRIEAEAEISRLIDFIYQLEKTSELFRISEIRLSPTKTASTILKIFIIVTQVQVI
jgi:Tfp pilus assembly protein PilO